MIKYLVDEAGTIKTFNALGNWEVVGTAKTEDVFINQGFDDYEIIPEAKWQELGAFDLLRWVQGDVTYQSVDQTLTRDTSYTLDGGFAISSLVQVANYPGGITGLSMFTASGN